VLDNQSSIQITAIWSGTTNVANRGLEAAEKLHVHSYVARGDERLVFSWWNRWKLFEKGGRSRVMVLQLHLWTSYSRHRSTSRSSPEVHNILLLTNTVLQQNPEH